MNLWIFCLIVAFFFFLLVYGNMSTWLKIYDLTTHMFAQFNDGIANLNQNFGSNI